MGSPRVFKDTKQEELNWQLHALEARYAHMCSVALLLVHVVSRGLVKGTSVSEVLENPNDGAG